MLFFSCIQAALFSAVAVFAAPESEVAEPDEFAAPQDGGTEETGERRQRLCSASSELSDTGRQYAMVWNSPREPDQCLRQKLGGEAPPDLPDCWKMGDDIGCEDIRDVN